MECKTGEVFKKINNNYSVSNLGNVRSDRKNIILKPGKRKDGYLVVNVLGYKHKKNWKIHQLVASHFLENKNNYTDINHINGIKSDNRAENLEWCTRSHNLKHAFATGLRKPVVNIEGKNGFSKKVINIDTNVIYDSLTQLVRINGYKYSALRAMLNGQNKNKTNYRYVTSPQK
jgi:hypothetical protein